ncbi:anaphase spindle elongation protein 1 [Podospora australis]|uniref:Anaphase spindle elongation protein 1 n=1 Tax=Podospora australis TaxID=1536484 RepID=A0AAN6WYM2_9PEZI|nr:anaphase spindle elongation protein 1 [Podospora australis]
MDTSYLAQQVNTIIGQLHGLFDEIGVSDHERESREEKLFDALSEALHNQVQLVATEKKELVEQAQKMITTIRQMEASLDGPKSRRQHEDEDLKVTYPLTRCIQVLKEKHIQMSRLHRERFEQVKKLVQALESYSLHLEPTFVKLTLPPTSPRHSIPSTFDLSPAYVDKLDAEFTRVYEEYTQRVATVKALGETIISLWAELGTPQAQTDNAIIKYYRDAPEQLGLHQEDIARLKSKRDKLLDEKRTREERLNNLRSSVEALWERLEVDEGERKTFLNRNRGCGIRQINEFEDELARLNELKRRNLHLFVDDARIKLQELWDALYLSEEEMLEFTPAFSDVCSDALLEAHEREILRLEVLKEQRAPTLALVDKHKSLVQERDELAASSQDASRLMMRGQKGERRDPGKLLREEKMRKRIAKELPKVIAELRKGLEQWEDEFGRPFLVHGERYLDVIEEEEPKPKATPGPRSRTPAQATANIGNSKPATLARAKSVGHLNNKDKPAPSRNGAKTPTASSTIRGNPTRSTAANTKDSPTRIPGRAPLSNLQHGNNSPARPLARTDSSRSETGSVRHVNNPLRAPPPKMRDLLPPPELETPANHFHRSVNLSSSIIRAVEPEDVYDDRYRRHPKETDSRPTSREYAPSDRSGSGHSSSASASYAHAPAPPPPAIRQISNTSTVVSGSENWETYDDTSEPEMDASEVYYAKVRAAAAASHHHQVPRRMTPEYGRHSQQSQQPVQMMMKRSRGLPPTSNGHAGHVMVDDDGNRIMSGSEWTDEDAF